jgi:2-dehydropantoate 2-reductase
MRIAIVGAGAVGCAYGALLARAGTDIVFVDPWREHVAAIDAHGLTVQLPGAGSWVVPATATPDPAGARGAEVVLVLTKAYSTAEAGRQLAPHLDADAVAVTLQNGLGNDRALAEAVGRERVIAGSTTVGSEVLGPGRVRLTPSAADGRSLTSLGLPPAGTSAHTRVVELAATLEGAALPVELRDDVAAVIWRKLAMTASIGPLCALMRCTVADALAHDAVRVVLRAGFDEVIAAAQAQGVDLDGEELWRHALATWEGIGPHPPSIAVDVASGRRTEIEALSGAVAEVCAQAGLEAPVSALTAAAIRAGEPAH